MKTTGCTVDGCERGVHLRGVCNAHYIRMRRRGTTDLYVRPTLAQRLQAKLVEQPNGCLEWTGYTNPAGYGQIGSGGRGNTALTHRVAWELANGPIPDGVLIRHYVCDNPPCCNVAHLRPGTNADNLGDMAAKGRASNGNIAKTHCPQRHRYSEANTYVDPTGRRHCRECGKSTTARYRQQITIEPGDLLNDEPS